MSSTSKPSAGTSNATAQPTPTPTPTPSPSGAVTGATKKMSGSSSAGTVANRKFNNIDALVVDATSDNASEMTVKELIEKLGFFKNFFLTGSKENDIVLQLQHSDPNACITKNCLVRLNVLISNYFASVGIKVVLDPQDGKQAVTPPEKYNKYPFDLFMNALVASSTSQTWGALGVEEASPLYITDENVIKALIENERRCADEMFSSNHILKTDKVVNIGGYGGFTARLQELGVKNAFTLEDPNRINEDFSNLPAVGREYMQRNGVEVISMQDFKKREGACDVVTIFNIAPNIKVDSTTLLDLQSAIPLDTSPEEKIRHLKKANLIDLIQKSSTLMAAESDSTMFVGTEAGEMHYLSSFHTLFMPKILKELFETIQPLSLQKHFPRSNEQYGALGGQTMLFKLQKPVEWD